MNPLSWFMIFMCQTKSNQLFQLNNQTIDSVDLFEYFIRVFDCSADLKYLDSRSIIQYDSTV